MPFPSLSCAQSHLQKNGSGGGGGGRGGGPPLPQGGGFKTFMYLLCLTSVRHRSRCVGSPASRGLQIHPQMPHRPQFVLQGGVVGVDLWFTPPGSPDTAAGMWCMHRAVQKHAHDSWWQHSWKEHSSRRRPGGVLSSRGRLSGLSRRLPQLSRLDVTQHAGCTPGGKLSCLCGYNYTTSVQHPPASTSPLCCPWIGAQPTNKQSTHQHAESETPRSQPVIQK
jgi:hypothetical protein